MMPSYGSSLRLSDGSNCREDLSAVRQRITDSLGPIASVVVDSRTCLSYSFSWSYCCSSAAAVITWALALAITAVAASPSSCCW